MSTDSELQSKYVVSCGNAAEEVSFEWSHHRIWSTDLKVTATHTKFIIPCGSTAEEVLFEWSHHRI